MRPEDVTIKMLATAMKFNEAQLWHFATILPTQYKPTRITLVKGKKREIDALYWDAKNRLRLLRKFIDQNIHPLRCVHGGVGGRSYVTSAHSHLGKKYIVTRDITEAYPSVKEAMIFGALRHRGFRTEVAKLLCMLFTLRGRIPTGSPVSSDALNIFFHSLDVRLASMAGRWHAGHSRIIDDFVISTNIRGDADAAGKLLDDAIAEAGLGVSDKKRRRFGLQPCCRVQTVHGLVVNSRRGPKVANKDQQRMIRFSEDYVRGAGRVSPESLPGLACKRARLTGYIYNCRQIRFSPAPYLLRQLQAGDRKVLRTLRMVGICSRDERWWVVSYGKHRRVLRNEPERLKSLWLMSKAQPLSASA